MRLIVEGKATLIELETVYSLDDLFDVLEAVDARAEAEADYLEQQRNKGK